MGTQGLQKMTQTIGGTLTKNSPTILTGLSVAGLISTAIMVGRATPKAMRLIDELEEEDRTTKNIIKRTYKCYVPAALMGAVTIGCIIGANSISLRRNAALAGAYSIAEKALNEYQAKVVETIGVNKEREIKDEIAKDRIRKNPVSSNEVIVTGRGETLCYDALSGRYFRGDMESIRAIINNFNKRLMSEMFISINELYYDFGLEGIKLGDDMGWFMDKDFIEPLFSSQLTEHGSPCLVIDFNVSPKYCDRDY